MLQSIVGKHSEVEFSGVLQSSETEIIILFMEGKAVFLAMLKDG